MTDENENRSPQGEQPPFVTARQLLEEIAALANRSLTVATFLGELLPRAVVLLQAEAGAIWMIDPERRLVLECEQGLMQTGFLGDPMMKAAFEQPFALALERGTVVSHSSHQESLDGQGRLFSVLLGGLRRGSDPAGLMQFIERNGSPAAEQPQRLKLLEQLCAFASQYISRAATGGPATAAPAPQAAAPAPIHTAPVPARPAAPGTLTLGPAVGAPAAAQPAAAVAATEIPPLDGLLSLYNHRRVRDVALVAANEGRRWLGVDRVSVAERVGTKLRLQAVSGSASVNPRSNVVQLLSSLADKVLQSGERLTFDGERRNLPPLLEAPLADYLHESRSRAVVIAPLFDPIAWKKFEESGLRAEKDPVPRPKPLGALVLEQISEAPLPPDLSSRIDRVAPHTALALRNAQAEERVLLLSLWKALGGYTSWFRGRRLAQIAAGVAAIALLTALLTLFPWDYRVEGKGKLMPVNRQSVFARHDGEVKDISRIESGKLVSAGEILVELRNDELQLKLVTASSQLNEKQQEIVRLEAQLNERDPNRNRAQEQEIHFKILQLKEETAGIEEQVENLELQVESLTIKAPISGRIATFRVQELLRGRPVRRGEVLVEIMDPSGPWHLELDVPEHRMGHILRAQKVSGSEDLPVRYVLATATEETWNGRLEKLGSRSVISEKEGAVVPVFAIPDPPLPPDPSIGAEVIAKINCGKRALGYVLFGDVIDFLRKRLWL